MRMNNLSARLKVNDWLKNTGREPLSAELSYEDFATELRKITAPKNVQVPFSSRSDAVSYIRHIANGLPIAIDEFEAAPRYTGSGRLLSPEDVSRVSQPESSK